MYVNDMHVSTLKIDKNLTQYLLEIPKGQYAKISIKNRFYKELATDKRQLYYIMNLSETE